MVDAPNPPYLGPPAHYSSGSNKPVHRIVLHGTVSPCREGEARRIATYFKSQSAGGSAHYCIDPGEVIQAAYDSVICWHAPPNGNSIGQELCDPVGDSQGHPLSIKRWDQPNYRSMLLLAAHNTAQLCLAYDVPPKMIGPRQLRAGAHGWCDHDDVSDAWHQSSHWDLGNFPRRRFQHLLNAAVADLQGKPDVAEEELKKADARLTRARDILANLARNAKPARRKRIRTALAELPKTMKGGLR